MKIEKIKAIPKYIQKMIVAKDKKSKYNYNAKRFYSYFTKNDGELVKVTVAARSYKGTIHLKQVAVHGINSTVCFVRDIAYNYLGGYMVGWHAEGLTKNKSYYEDGNWYTYPKERLFDPFAPVINMDYILSLPEFKYCAINLYPYTNVLKYLRAYSKYPEVEFISKLGLFNIVLSKQILQLARNDKTFRKWLGKNRNELMFSSYDIKVIIDAYKTKQDMRTLQAKQDKRKSFYHQEGLTDLRAFVRGETDKFIAYIDEQKTTFRNYNDYLQACLNLNIDMSLPKNRYPKDFKRWHDIRIDEYNTAKAMKDAEERKEFYTKFALIAEKYLALEHNKKSAYMAIIPHSPADLLAEGNTLHHCVGRMGYDQKFVREESLIFFIRLREKPDIPYITVEYSPKSHRILQMHGVNNTAPNEETKKYIQNTWLPYANRHLKQITA